MPSVVPNGGFLICVSSSPFKENEALLIDFENDDWYCDPDRTKCPGGALNGIGCTVPDCTFSVNPLGECECDGQFFINADCDMGKYFWSSQSLNLRSKTGHKNVNLIYSKNQTKHMFIYLICAFFHLASEITKNELNNAF